MALLKQSMTYTRSFKMISSTDHFSLKTSASPVVNLSKAGAAFGAAAGSVAEVASGWYTVALSTADTNTLGDLAFYITGTGADDTDFCDQVSALMDTEIALILAEVAAIKDKTDQLTFTIANQVDSTMTVASLSAATANYIADHILRRSLATALASADGDTKGFRSLAGAISKLVNKVAPSGSNLITYETNDTTQLGVQVMTTDAAALPITALDTA